MSSAITKYISILFYVLMGISALLGALFYLDLTSENLFLIWTYILFGGAAIATFIFSIVGLFMNQKAAKRSLVSFGIVAVIILVGYILASGEILTFSGYEEFFYENNSMDPNVFSKLVGTSLYTMYIFGIVAIVSMFYSEISKLFR
jgi:magnesium-transporting ATPase (P-type)